MTTALDSISHLNPCEEASLWLLTFSDPKTAWENCNNTSWMTWLLRELEFDKAFYVKLAVVFARSASHLTSVPEALAAIKAAETWLKNPTEENRNAAYAAAAAAAAAAADAADAAYATRAAIRAADSAFNLPNLIRANVSFSEVERKLK